MIERVEIWLGIPEKIVLPGQRSFQPKRYVGNSIGRLMLF